MGEQLPTRTDDPDAHGLSLRESQILQLATQGNTDQCIANHLGISLATVSTYWGRVRIKLGPLNRAELVAKYLRAESERALHILRCENERLIRELEEHTKTEEMLRTSLELFRGLLETAPDAILLVAEDGTIQFSNRQATILFGYSPMELQGISVESLIPERFRRNHLQYRSEYSQNPINRQMGGHLATMALRKDGTEFPMATALSATKTNKGLIVTCILRDLTANYPKILTA